ncbi:hypothetical protein QOZ80_1AG0005490 [Eleusine coracana subsp. coracana]|nr:hypothetical protein QOZ80_1AG0005490 [Eleusine coracana subsp. coracana]
MASPASHRHRRRSRLLSWPLLFFAILAVHSFAVYLFTRGFLLTRTELALHSSRDDRPRDVSPGCASWPPPAVDRLVIVVLDALRFDFVAPSTLFQEKQPWMDKLQVLQELAANEKTSAKIFKALADPPTTSLQRLKALTTGGLPTFIDVGNSFGAPAIVEDNIMYQLVKNGKRVVMMGDDTWIQLYPEHFNKSFPYPSFNVKDLDTVDNGVIEHLLPSLHRNDWDVLIAHFLGVDHAGHIFGVDSTPMTHKLEQYNKILEGVVDTLRSLSKPGVPHENTLLLVMGDHGQTLNGDHGGGTAEEVETSLFAWSPKAPPDAVLSVLGESSCVIDMHGKEVCISTMQQLDFAATISALLGIPFPFGSIGRVNPDLYALSAGTWDSKRMGANACTSQNDVEAWMRRYAEVLCINSWQVKRYVDVYSATSVIGFPSEVLQHVTDLYSKAQTNCYILAEGRVANFLLATSCIVSVWYSVMKGKFSREDFVFLLLNVFTRFGIEIGMSKQLTGPSISNDHPHLKTDKRIANFSAAMLCSWSPTILILLGRQGPFVALICMTGVWCIIKSQQKHQRELKHDTSKLCVAHPVSVVQWSLLAVCLFYLTGHWCTFDGLRYGAAFIGFDHFQIIRQGLLLSIDTFGVSHILPILSLPFIALVWCNTASRGKKVKDGIINSLTQVLLMYGLIAAITATLTIICVTIQRRHLMVWGLFAPKYVFDAIGLLLTDLLICLASIYYS